MTLLQQENRSLSQSHLAKRIKRHVIGRRHQFFAATAPGLEPLAADEIGALVGEIDDIRGVAGGIAFSGRLHDCYAVNLYARTINRVLMRVVEFGATNFRQFEKKIADLAWELYLPYAARPRLHITTRQCRLFHKEALAEHVKNGLQKRWAEITAYGEGETATDKNAGSIFILGENDRFTVSVDSSGALLHKRGYKTDVGPAPIRETLAAAILMQAGYDGRLPLIDAMCGSGTFTLEAAMMAGKIPPGIDRDFDFMRWPGFRAQRWHHMKKQAQKASVALKAGAVLAADQRPEACRDFERRCARLGLAEAIRIVQVDFKQLAPEQYFDRPGLVVINPPYGRRLGTPKQSVALLKDISRILQSQYGGWQLALIIPQKHQAEMFPFKLQQHRLFHGGLKLTLLIGRIPSPIGMEI